MNSRFLRPLACAWLCATLELSAATHVVDTIPMLIAKIAEAVPGDTIVVKDGIYTTASAITVRRSGTVEQPITISAETVGGVEINGTNGFNLLSPAAHIVISGFKFTHAAGKNTIGEGTAYVRFTRNTFQCTGTGPYLSVVGDDAQIDHNDFAGKKTVGSMIAVGGTGSQVARRVWIHRNLLRDFVYTGTTTVEMIRFGLSALANSTGSGLVEHNLFANCRGPELISNRSSGNIYRYNTFVDSPTAQMSLRHGNACLVYGNIYRNTEGLRIFGQRHHVFSNYFEGNYIGVHLGNGSPDTPDADRLVGHDRPDHCIVAFNTFVDNRTHYQMSQRANGTGASHTTFANNLIQGGGLAAKIDGPNTDPIWLGNILWKSASGSIPGEGFTTIDPELVRDETGVFRPDIGSPAIDAGAGDFPGVGFDLDGQPRPGIKDVGADEVSADPVSARMLSVAEVGPAAP